MDHMIIDDIIAGSHDLGLHHTLVCCEHSLQYQIHCHWSSLQLSLIYHLLLERHLVL